jgi:hypothetical protein
MDYVVWLFPEWGTVFGSGIVHSPGDGSFPPLVMNKHLPEVAGNRYF